ncbi:hypothetical protein MRB53_026160 [Persea americana]|uniref:Uncharacterized protein n=1 Tax=Persea americana TaxID=3435 RepID=A0ACC2LHC1_PERAE|nr:hypothetical protein MRB53_026160 [Persea americana]
MSFPPPPAQSLLLSPTTSTGQPPPQLPFPTTSTGQPPPQLPFPTTSTIQPLPALHPHPLHPFLTSTVQPLLALHPQLSTLPVPSQLQSNQLQPIFLQPLNFPPLPTQSPPLHHPAYSSTEPGLPTSVSLGRPELQQGPSTLPFCPSSVAQSQCHLPTQISSSFGLNLPLNPCSSALPLVPSRPLVQPPYTLQPTPTTISQALPSISSTSAPGQYATTQKANPPSLNDLPYDVVFVILQKFSSPSIDICNPFSILDHRSFLDLAHNPSIYGHNLQAFSEGNSSIELPPGFDTPSDLPTLPLVPTSSHCSAQPP